MPDNKNHPLNIIHMLFVLECSVLSLSSLCTFCFFNPCITDPLCPTGANTFPPNQVFTGRATQSWVLNNPLQQILITIIYVCVCVCVCACACVCAHHRCQSTPAHSINSCLMTVL